MNREPIVLEAHGKHAQAVEFTLDGKKLVSVGQDRYVRVWSVPAFKPVAAFEGHRNSVNTIAFSPDGALLATGASDGTVRVWSFPEGRCVHILEDQGTPVFSPDDVTLATVSTKGDVVLWDADRGKERHTIPRLDARPLALAFTAEGDLLVGGAGPIHRLALPAGEHAGKLQGHALAVACLRLAPDGKLLASTGLDATLRLWSTRTWTEIRQTKLKTRGVFQLALSAKRDAVAVSADHVIELFSTRDGRLMERLELPVKGVYGLAFSPNSRYLANAAADGKVRVWAFEP